MCWPELLKGFAVALATELDGFIVATGLWARVPNVDSVYIHLDREAIQQNRYRDLTLHVYVFAAPPNTVEDVQATLEKLEQVQRQVEDVAVNVLTGLGPVSAVTLRVWENDSGEYLPLCASRLTLDMQAFQPAPQRFPDLACVPPAGGS